MSHSSPAFAFELAPEPQVLAAARSLAAMIEAGEAITRGMPLYIDASDSNRWKKASTASVAASAVRAIATQDAAAGQPLRGQVGGDIDIGATLTVGESYGVGDTAGSICPLSDNGSADFPAFIGWAITAARLRLAFAAAGVAKA